MNYQIAPVITLGGRTRDTVARAVVDVLFRDCLIRNSCPDCGRPCFSGRRATRRAARRMYPGQHMRAELCPRSGFWHMTDKFEKAKAKHHRTTVKEPVAQLAAR